MNDARREWFERGRWTGSPRHVLAFALVVAGLIFYVLLADALGFFLCAIVILIALFLCLQVQATKAVPLAVVSTLVVHTIFYKFLKVPLPWGPLAGDVVTAACRFCPQPSTWFFSPTC